MIQTVWKALLWLGIVLSVVSALVRVVWCTFFGSEPLASGPMRLYAWVASPAWGAASLDSVRWLLEALFPVERVEEDPERELLEPEEEELGFTRRALGASASSLKGKNEQDSKDKLQDYQGCGDSHESYFLLRFFFFFQ